jgi:hypothetical protein
MATQYSVNAVQATMVANTAKTILEIPSSATAGFLVVALEVMSAVTTPAGTLIIEWMTYTTGGTATTFTPQKYGTDQGVVANLGVVKVAHSVEPSGLAAGTLPNWIVPLPGMYSIVYPSGREFFQPISTLRCLRLTSSVAGAVRVNLVIEI